VTYILDTGCPTCDAPAQMELEWTCGEAEDCDGGHEVELLYTCLNGHHWTSEAEGFPG
jgi:hypothetical protein